MGLKYFSREQCKKDIEAIIEKAKVINQNNDQRYAHYVKKICIDGMYLETKYNKIYIAKVLVSLELRPEFMGMSEKGIRKGVFPGLRYKPAQWKLALSKKRIEVLLQEGVETCEFIADCWLSLHTGAEVVFSDKLGDDLF